MDRRVPSVRHAIKSRRCCYLPFLQCEHGPDFSLDLKEMKASLKVLKEIQHPFILSPTSADFDDSGLLIVREFVSNGSLKDAIYGKTPKGTALAKYSQPASIRRLSLSNIKLYGRQVLEALNFLSQRGFVMGTCSYRGVDTGYRECERLCD